MTPYTATLVTFIIPIAFLHMMDFLAQLGFLESRLSRKIIHTGPVILLFRSRPDMFISRLYPG